MHLDFRSQRDFGTDVSLDVDVALNNNFEGILQQLLTLVANVSVKRLNTRHRRCDAASFSKYLQTLHKLSYMRIRFEARAFSGQFSSIVRIFGPY